MEKELEKREIVLLQEAEVGWGFWINFKIDKHRYQMSLYSPGEPDENYYISIRHLESKCFSCEMPIKEQHCLYLMDFKKELFEHLLPQSKYRLKWVTSDFE